MKVACLGTGVMGGALMKAVVKVVGGKNLFVADGDIEKAKKFAEENDCIYCNSNREAVENADIVFIAVKPAFVSTVLDDVGTLFADKIVVSVAAGLSIESIKEMYSFSAMMCGGGEEKITFLRIMPNTPAVVGESMIALCSDSELPSDVAKDACDKVASILAPAGKVECVSEKLMNTVTAISGSGPAYGFMFIEALADAAVRLGMTRNQGYLYAAQTLKGAAAMVLETGSHPAALKDGVCSPAGTTIEAVKVLEEKGFRAAIINAAEAAYEKAEELGRKK